jgi:hypothetical protein
MPAFDRTRLVPICPTPGRKEPLSRTAQLRSLSIGTLVLITACGTEYVPTTQGENVTLDEVGTESQPILWDQTSGSIVYHSFESDALQAVDFVVPTAARWTVTELRVTGAILATSGQLVFTIRLDDGGVPGTTVQGFSLSPSSIEPCCGGVSQHYQLTLGTPLTLTTGTYWLVVEMGPDAFYQWQGTAVLGSVALRSLDGGQSWSSSVSDRTFALYGVEETPTTETNDLVTALEGLGLAEGVTKSLRAKLNSAIAALADGDTAGACSALRAFISEVTAQTGKKITLVQAEMLIEEANSIRDLLGC